MRCLFCQALMGLDDENDHCSNCLGLGKALTQPFTNCRIMWKAWISGKERNDPSGAGLNWLLKQASNVTVGPSWNRSVGSFVARL